MSDTSAPATRVPLTRDSVLDLARTWWLCLLLGILWILFGTFVLSYNVGSQLALAVVIGITFIGTGVHEVVAAGRVERWQWLWLVGGVFSVVAGIITFVWPGHSLRYLAGILAWFLVIKGIVDVVGAFASIGRPWWWTTLLLGMVELLLGIWAAGYPGRSLFVFVNLVGIYAVFHGFAEVLAAFELRLGQARPRRSASSRVPRGDHHAMTMSKGAAAMGENDPGSGQTMALPQGHLRLLESTVARRLLTLAIPARVAYVALDGTPRIVPSWFHWTGDELVMPTFLAAPHVHRAAARLGALRANPQVAVSIDTEGFPPEVLLVRGRVAITEVDGVAPEYALAARRYLGEDAAAEYLHQIDRPGTRMARIALRPSWVGLVDFQARPPRNMAGAGG